MILKEEAGGFSRLTEATQYEQAQAGCRESLNRLMSQHEGLVHYAVKHQEWYGLPRDEVLQAGRSGLVRAILGYRVERGTKFSTYAYKAIIRQVWNAVRDHLRRERKRVSMPVLKIYVYEVGADPAQQQDWADVCQSMMELINRLPRQQAEVIRLRYGLGGDKPQTQAEVGIRIGVSRQRVGQIEMEAMAWLRQPAHSQELRSLLARHNQAQYELADQLTQNWLRQRGGRSGQHETLP